jgi:hypothetical protein
LKGKTLSTTLLDNARTGLDALRAKYAGPDFEARIAAANTVAEVDQIEAEARDALSVAQRKFDSLSTHTDARATSVHLIPTGDFRVSELDIYTKTGPNSFVRDLYLSRSQADPDATERLNRHNAERRQAVEARAAFVTPNFYPPQWADKEWVETKRQRRVVAELVQQLPLPPYGNTLEIPAYNEAPTNAADVQTADGQLVTSNAPSGANVLTAPVSTYAGYLDVPRQTVERGLPGLDWSSLATSRRTSTASSICTALAVQEAPASRQASSTRQASAPSRSRTRSAWRTSTPTWRTRLSRSRRRSTSRLTESSPTHAESAGCSHRWTATVAR